MNCEQVEELLSAYLDNALASEDRQQVAAHLRQCPRCSAILADYRRFDILLAKMPHVSPDPALRDRIFSSPEYLELAGTLDESSAVGENRVLPDTLPKILARFPQRNTPGRPQLIALPGGRTASSTSAPTQKHRRVLSPGKRRRKALFVMMAAIAAVLFVMVGFGRLLYTYVWSQPVQTVSGGAITPPAGPQTNGPLSAGMRFVFLRDGTLWSVPIDGSSQGDRLTPISVTVSANWVVSPPLPGSSAGDRLAYIDLQHASVHIIRSDGQQDTIVKQPLLKAGITPASIWDTAEGGAILNSLAWSPDGSMLAFVADSTDTGQTSLYILSTQTGTIEKIPVPGNGSVAHPVWSPDGARLAFELAHSGTVSILDYNIQSHGLLNLTAGVNIQTSANNEVLSLNWSPDANTPVVTWSVGTPGHVHSIWEHRVGVGGTAQAQLLAHGDFADAIYSRAGHGGIGSWLLVTPIPRGTALQSVDVLSQATIVTLTSAKQVNLAWWSPDGNQVDYLDALSSNVGTLHVLTLSTGSDTLVAKGVASNPAPAWSIDSQQLAYSTGTQTFVVDLHAANTAHQLPLRGPAFTYLWSASHQLVVALGDGHEGIYLVDTQHDTVTQLDKQGISGPIAWTEIP
jgi:Putative zinc-finger/WD40-like Beta Propeller Repeat